MKKTRLHQHHLNLHAKMIEYAQFDMPIVYSDISKEHLAVRENIGIFDVSHMGEFLIEGSDAIKFVNKLVTNTIVLDTSKVTYALMLNEEGFVIDDLLVYVIRPDLVLLVVNASNIEKDYNWVLSQSQGFEVNCRNVSDEYSQIAIQGPKTKDIINELLDQEVTDLSFMTYRVVPYLDGYVIASRTGYTGEDGFEIYGGHHLVERLWEKALEHGATPCGLGARDTLRFEANLPLYGHEIDDGITPLEAGLSFAVKLEKEFIGRSVLLAQKDHLKRKIVGLVLNEKGIPRQGYEVYSKDDQQIGYITTGYLSPSFAKPIALAMVKIDYAVIGQEMDVLIRGKKVPATITSRKFLQKKYKK